MALEGEGALLKNHLAGVVAEGLQAQNDPGVEAEGAVLQTRLGEGEVEAHQVPQILLQEEAGEVEQKVQNGQGVAGEVLGVSLRLSQER